MTTVRDILQFVESLAPGYMAEPWDSFGLLCGRENQAVKKVLVSLDPFADICQEAIDVKADLLLTHHPLLFKESLTAVNDTTPTGKLLIELISNNISAINAHTNLDCAPGGVNDVLAETLGLADIAVVSPKGTDENGRPYGFLRSGTVKKQDLADFLSFVKERLDCNGLRYVSSGKPVCKVAVGGGACADEVYDAYRAGCDTFITADIKYNPFRTGYDLGMNMIDAGHFQTENPVMPILAKKVQDKFPEIEVVLSKIHHDPVKFFI